jgi:hypothetical protein
VRLKIVSTLVLERKIVAAKTGKPYVFREQEAVVQLGVETRLVCLSLEDSQAAYPVGEYEVLVDQCLEVDRNRKLALKRQLALKPVVAGVAQTRVAG